MSKGFTAPVSGGGDFKRIENVELIPVGFQLCTFYGLCDIGTHDGNFGESHNVNFAFEFPKHLRVFYEDSDPKPACVFKDMKLSMNEKSNLRKKFIGPMIGRVLTDEEAENFDISSLLGKSFVATISHSPDGKWANISALAPLDDSNKALFGLQSTVVDQINKTYFFHLSDGFESQNFALLPSTKKKKLKESKEGLAHAAAGGTFAENQTPSTVQNGKKLEMIDKSAPYEAFITAGWTDAQLVEHGKAKYIEPIPAPAPVVQSAPPLSPTALPIPQTPPSVPVIEKQKVIVMKDKTQNIEDYRKAGWTDELLIEHGHAVFQ